MNAKEIITKLKSQIAGSYLAVITEKPLKARKGVAGKFVKTSKLIVRAGISYDAQKAVQAKRESGEAPATNQGLPFGEWISFPYHIGHKGKDYIRLYLSPIHKAQTVYTLDGKEISKETAQELCLASNFSKGGKPDCITVSADNIKAIG